MVSYIAYVVRAVYCMLRVLAILALVSQSVERTVRHVGQVLQKDS